MRDFDTSAPLMLVIVRSSGWHCGTIAGELPDFSGMMLNDRIPHYEIRLEKKFG